MTKRRGSILTLTAALVLQLVGRPAAAQSRPAVQPAAVQITSGTGAWFWPSWSPDGREILAAGKRDGGDDEIYLMQSDGSALRVLGSSPANEIHPQWSPTGEFIVFDSNRQGADDVFLIRHDGSGLRQLTAHPAADGAAVPSPDGQRIAFMSQRSGNWLLYTAGADGSGERLFQRSTSVFDPSWSRDRKRILFMTDAPNNDLLEVPMEGGVPRAFVATQTSESGGKWSPDGTRVLFIRGDQTTSHLFVADSRGRDVRRLARLPGVVGWPAWCPDGNRVVFTARSEGNEDVCAVRITNGAVQRLTDHPARDAAPSCDTRGRVVFASARVPRLHLFVVTIPYFQ